MKQYKYTTVEFEVVSITAIACKTATFIVCLDIVVYEQVNVSPSPYPSSLRLTRCDNAQEDTRPTLNS